LGIVVVAMFFLNKTLIGNPSEPEVGFAIQPLSQGFTDLEVEPPRGGSTSGNDKYDLKKFPAPETFRTFNRTEKELSISGNCSDKYYTIIIYKKGIDYRDKPSAAVFNTAFDCPSGGLFNRKISLSDINLGGSDYYVIVANQGNEGTWYNPR